MLGTSIEWFDFFLYGTAAALVFNKIFFPKLDPVTGTLAAFATYAVGFVGRPLGGIIFGHIGDRIGRKATLLLTLLLMGVPTVLIGLLPPYAVLGYWAAVLLVLLRLVQGVAVGGEWGGAVLMAVEHAPAGQKGFFGSLPQMGVGPGLIMSSVAMSLVSGLPEAEMLSWGWRIPFVFSIVLLGIGWFIRSRVPESPEFLAVRNENAERSVPALVVLRDYPRALLTIIGARIAENTWFYTVTTFALSYATGTLHLGRSQVLNAVTAGAALSVVTMPAMGYLSDRIGQRRLFAIGMVVMCLFAYPFFAMLATRDLALVWTAMVLAIGVVFAVLYAPESMLFAAQFPAAVRYSGISISVQLAGALGGGLAPVVATALLRHYDGDARPVAGYLLALGFVALLCTGFMKSTRQRA
jgi:metabolite-proton symporter